MTAREDRAFLAEALVAPRQLEGRLRGALRAGFAWPVARLATREAALHAVLVVDALRDGIREMEG